jgi:hypothetical protein
MGTRLLPAVLLAVAVTGCGGGGDPAPRASATPAPGGEQSAAAAPPDDEGAIAALLAERATQLERADAPALARTSAGGQRARDRVAARRAKRLSLQRVRYGVAESQTSGDRATLAVSFSYRVRGMSRPFRTARVVKASKAGGRWRVTRERPVRDPLPWEVARFRVVRRPHVVLLAAPGVDAGRLSAGLESAYREIRRDLPRRDLPRSVLALAAADHAQAERLAGRIARGVVALANVAVEWGPPPARAVERVLAQRMIVIESTWASQDEAGRHGTLVHEMTHTALDPDTSARIPPWLVEGLAMHVSNDDRRAEAQARAAGAAKAIGLRALCKRDAIFSMNGRDQAAAYAASSAAAYAIADRHGTKGLFRLYDAFNDPDIAGGPGARTTDRVMRRTIGMSLAELQDAIG